MNGLRPLIIFIVFLTCTGIIFSGSKSSFAEVVVQKTDFDKALSLAEKDRVETQLEIGVVYDLGLGTPQNDVETHKWFKLAKIVEYVPDAAFIPIDQQSNDWAIISGFKHSMYQQFGENWREIITVTLLLIAIASYLILRRGYFKNLSDVITTFEMQRNDKQDTNLLFREKGNRIMNLKQITILKGAAALILVSFLFPPFESVHPYGGERNAGYSFILSYPKGDWGGAAIVNIDMLLTEWVGILLLAGILWLLQIDKKSDN